MLASTSFAVVRALQKTHQQNAKCQFDANEVFWGGSGMFCWCGWNSSVAGPIWGLGDVFGALHTSLLLKSIFVSLLGLHVLSVTRKTHGPALSQGLSASRYAHASYRCPR